LETGDEPVVTDAYHTRHAAVVIEAASANDDQPHPALGPQGVKVCQPVGNLAVRGISKMHGRHNNTIFKFHAINRYGREQIRIFHFLSPRKKGVVSSQQSIVTGCWIQEAGTLGGKDAGKRFKDELPTSNFQRRTKNKKLVTDHWSQIVVGWAAPTNFSDYGSLINKTGLK
jgi:hypothetical protein